MAQREQIDKDLKTAFYFWMAALLGFLACVPLLLGGHKSAVFIVFPLVLILYVFAFQKTIRIKCRGCDRPFGPAIWYGKFLRVGGVIRKTSEELRHCPRCGEPLD